MKRLLLACCLVAASGTVVMAQNKATLTPQEQKIDQKTLFASKINELDANLIRKDEQTAKNTYLTLAAMMQTRITEKQKAQQAATSETERKAIEKTMKEMQQLYGETKNLYPTLSTGNSTEMVTKLKAFLAIY